MRWKFSLYSLTFMILPLPLSYFISVDLTFFLGTFVKKGIDVSEKLYWKHKKFLFQQWKKGRYICQYMSDSQYKSRENTKMYVYIVASWLQLIYILWVFYVRILSICHNSINASIYVGLILYHLFTVRKAIIKWDLYLGALSNVMLICLKLVCVVDHTYRQTYT